LEKKEFLNTILPCKNTLYRLAKRLLVSSDEAEDAVQEVFLKLWKRRDKIHHYRSPEAFAVTMTKNYCLDRLKSRQASNLQIVHTNYKNSDNIEKDVEATEGLELVTEIMQTLPEKQKMIMQLRDIEQFEFAEISQILEINETAIRVALSRARKAVREQLMKQYNYGVS
jgi:RNA polymerase sigma-70 factor (ECF subfamily)